MISLLCGCVFEDSLSFNSLGPPSEGLVGHYTFNGNADDQSGNGNDGDFIGSLSTDRFGNDDSSILLEGNGDYFECPQSITLANYPWTFSMWFSLNTLPSNVSDAFLLTSKTVDFGDDVHLFVDDSDNEIKFFTNDGFLKQSTNIAVEPNVWYHVALEYDENTIRIYVNGDLRIAWSETRYSTIYPADAPLIVSSIFPGDQLKGRIFGQIDDIRIYEIALGETKVKQLFESEVFELVF